MEKVSQATASAGSCYLGLATLLSAFPEPAPIPPLASAALLLPYSHQSFLLPGILGKALLP